MVNPITNTAVTVCYCDFRECSQNLREPPCVTDFYEVYPFYPPLWDAAGKSVAVLANLANLLKTRVAFRRTWPPRS